VAEIVLLGQMDNTLDNTFESANRVYSRFGICPTIPTCAGGGIQPKVMEITKMMKYKIRKLTPKECFRLMNYTDADFEKAAKVNSNSQLYKQAGNAIVKSCLMAIFSQLNLKGVKKWNDMSVEERQKLVEGEK
jgi:site-specific DNA-cytosine methylase